MNELFKERSPKIRHPCLYLSPGLKGVYHDRLTKFFEFNGKYQLTNPESQQAPREINQTNGTFPNQPDGENTQIEGGRNEKPREHRGHSLYQGTPETVRTRT